MTSLRPSDSDFPSLLREIFDPPGILYVDGVSAAWDAPCVAMVGTRRATAYGESVAFEFARTLAAHGVCIVSGLAYGIDAAAHRGALEAGGKTVAVLATPLDEVSPTAHRKLARDIVENGGAVITEKAPGMETHKVDYLIRNRIIAGMCRATVVVEAGFPSGALNTANHALRESRDVFAVPGRITDLMSQGSNHLLAEGARLLSSPKEVLEFLKEAGAKITGGSPGAMPILKGVESVVVDLLTGGPAHAGELMELSKAPPAELYEALSNLEMKGIVWLCADQRYALCGG